MIEKFLYDGLNVFVLGRKIINIFNFNSENFPVKSNLFISQITDELFLTKIEDINLFPTQNVMFRNFQ